VLNNLLTELSTDFVDNQVVTFHREIATVSDIAKTPAPPYYAVIFTSLHTDTTDGYDTTADRMVELAAQQTGFLGVESARDECGITVSYWQSLEAIKEWKQHAEHLQAQRAGQRTWYRDYKTRIALVERDYGFSE
jgi:heme-degrading monooxygenase HmoA